MSNDRKEYYSIYILSCPITNSVKYVGKTNNLFSRYKNHCYNPEANLMKFWVESLSYINEFPIMTELHRTESEEEALKLEREAIFLYGKTNRLLNMRLTDTQKFPYPINYLSKKSLIKDTYEKQLYKSKAELAATDLLESLIDIVKVFDLDNLTQGDVKRIEKANRAIKKATE